MEVNYSDNKCKNFEGICTHDSISDCTAKLYNIINNIIDKKSYANYKVDIKVILTNGGNYLGELYEIDIKGETADGSREINLFVKHMPNADGMKIMNLPGIYETEIFAYNSLHTVFDELQNEANIPLNERFKMVNSYNGHSNEALVLENISKKGYKPPHRMNVVNLEFAEFAVNLLAKFHSLSFAIREKRPLYYDTVLKNRKSQIIFGKYWQDFMKTMCQRSMSCLDLSPNERLEKILMSLLDKLPLYIQDTSGICCLCHGDYRPTNIMTKEVGGKIVDLIPIDYQLMYFGSPALDFINFIYIATDQKLRIAHLGKLKDLYYETMRKFLLYFDINVEFVFPRSEFERAYEEKMDFGLVNLLVYGPLMFAEEDDVPDMSKISLNSKQFKLNNKLKIKLLEAIDDTIKMENKYL